MSDNAAGETPDAFALLWEAVDAGQVEIVRTGLAGYSWVLAPLSLLVMLTLAIASGMSTIVNDPAPVVLRAIAGGLGGLVLWRFVAAAQAAWMKRLRNDPARFEALWRAGGFTLAAPMTTLTGRVEVPRGGSAAYPDHWRVWLSGWLAIPLDVPQREPADTDPFAHALLWRLHDAGKLAVELGPAAMPRDLPQDEAEAVAALRASPRAFARAIASNAVTIELRWPRDIILRRTQRTSGEAAWGEIVRRFARQAHFRDAAARAPRPVRDGRELPPLVDTAATEDAVLLLTEAVRNHRILVEPPRESSAIRWLLILVALPAFLAAKAFAVQGSDGAFWAAAFIGAAALVIVPAWRRLVARRALSARILREPEDIDRLWRQGAFQLRSLDRPIGTLGADPVISHPADWRRWVATYGRRRDR